MAARDPSCPSTIQKMLGRIRIAMWKQRTGLILAVWQGGSRNRFRAHSLHLCMPLIPFFMSIFPYLAARFLSKLLQPIDQIVFGMALVSPNLAAQISRLAGKQQGESLGWQSAAESTGQVAGPLAGTLLFSLCARLPHLLAGAFLVGVGAPAAFMKRAKARGGRTADG